MQIPAALLTITLAAQAAPQPSIDAVGRAYHLFLEGRSLAEADDVPTAINRYRQALTLLGDSSDIRTELATLYARQDKISEARAEAERAVDLDGENRAAHRILGLIEAAELQNTPVGPADPTLSRAMTHLERALRDGFEDPAASLTLADVYIRAGRYPQAIATLNDFLLDRPGYLQAVLLLAQAYRGAGQPDEAERLLGSIGGEGRGLPSPTRAVDGLERQGRWREAADAWTAIVKDNPGNAGFRLRQATAFANSGQLGLARDTLTDLLVTTPSEIAAYYLLAQVELRDGQADAAEGAALRIAQLDPEDARGPLMLAEVRTRRGNHRGVVTALEARVKAAPQSDVDSGAFAQMAGLLSSALVELDDTARAVEVLETARKRAPEDHDLLFSLAATYEQTDRIDQAERTFRELVAADPTHASGLNYLGYMLADRGRKLDEAVGFITRALAIEADNPSFLDSLGWAYYKQSKFADALSPLERAAAAAVESSVIQDHLGDLYVQLKRYREAEAAFGRSLDGDGRGIDAAEIRRKRDNARARAAGSGSN